MKLNRLSVITTFSFSSRVEYYCMSSNKRTDFSKNWYYCVYVCNELDFVTNPCSLGIGRLASLYHTSLGTNDTLFFARVMSTKYSINHSAELDRNDIELIFIKTNRYLTIRTGFDFSFQKLYSIG